MFCSLQQSFLPFHKKKKKILPSFNFEDSSDISRRQIFVEAAMHHFAEQHCLWLIPHTFQQPQQHHNTTTATTKRCTCVFTSAAQLFFKMHSCSPTDTIFSLFFSTLVTDRKNPFIPVLVHPLRPNCDSYNEETVQHFLLKCLKLDEL